MVGRCQVASSLTLLSFPVAADFLEHGQQQNVISFSRSATFPRRTFPLSTLMTAPLRCHLAAVFIPQINNHSNNTSLTIDCQWCKQSNYDFCISQGSVATVFRWGGQNYSQVSSRYWKQKIITIGQRFTELFQKNNICTDFFFGGGRRTNKATKGTHQRRCCCLARTAPVWSVVFDRDESSGDSLC